MTIFLKPAPQYCENTGTSQKVTNAISEKPDTVRTLANSLICVINKAHRFFAESDMLIFQSQVDELIKLTSSDKINAPEIQKCARATKHIFSALEKQYSTDDSDAKKHFNVYKAYKIAKAIQNNDSSLLEPHARVSNIKSK